MEIKAKQISENHIWGEGTYYDPAHIKLVGINEDYVITTSGTIIHYSKPNNKISVPFYEPTVNRILVEIAGEYYDYKMICQEYLYNGGSLYQECYRDRVNELMRNGHIHCDKNTFLSLKTIIDNNASVELDYLKNKIKSKYGADCDLLKD